MHNFAGNYPNDNRFVTSNWMCWCGLDKEKEQHIIIECNLYKDIRNKYAVLDNDEKLTNFMKVLNRRDEIDKKSD